MERNEMEALLQAQQAMWRQQADYLRDQSRREREQACRRNTGDAWVALATTTTMGTAFHPDPEVFMQGQIKAMRYMVNSALAYGGLPAIPDTGPGGE